MTKNVREKSVVALIRNMRGIFFMHIGKVCEIRVRQPPKNVCFLIFSHYVMQSEI